MFDTEKNAFIALNTTEKLTLISKMMNRHGLVTGATGTGKTVTLQTLAETFSQMGIAVFAADIKGDLSGIATAGGSNSSVSKRVEEYKLADQGFAYQAFPVQFWDVFGEQGTPIRATIADMGPLLISRLLNLNDTQVAVLTVIFKMTQDEKLELVDFKDLQKILEYFATTPEDLSTAYGNISKASLGTIQRNLLSLEQEGVASFFGEPALNINDLMRTENGKGVINILASDKLMSMPKVYSTFLLWLMTKLFEILPEVGDLEQPKLVFFFDEAHLLFDNAPKVLLEKIEQVVRLIRSKGVGIFFISQTPSDIPDSVLGQLGNRVQHALRAYTPKDQKALKAAAQSFRTNPAFDTEKTLTELGIGEALVSFLDKTGTSQVVDRAFILPPQGQVGPIEQTTRTALIQGSPLHARYAQVQDRTSAYEIVTERLQNTLSKKDQVAQQKADEKVQKEQEKEQKAQEKQSAKDKKMILDVAKSVIVPIGKQLLNILFKRK